MYKPTIIKQITTSTVLDLKDYIVLVNNGATAITITFPSPVNNDGKEIIVKRYNNTSTGVITLNGGGGNIESNTGIFAITTILPTTNTLRRARYITISGLRHLID